MSDLELIEFTYSWILENYSMCYQYPGKCISSPNFKIRNMNKCKWSLLIYPRGYSEEYKEYVSCFLCSERRNIPKLDRRDDIVDFEIKMVGANGETLRILRAENCLFQPGSQNVWGWHEYIERKSVEEKIKDWPKDNLVLTCYINIKRYEPKHLEINGLTRIAVDKCSFDWKVSVPPFSTWSLNKEVNLCSTLTLEIILSASDKDLKISILKKNQNSLDALIRFRLILLNLEGFEICSENASHIFESDPKEDPWDFPILITKEQLESQKCSNAFSLVFLCSVSDGITIVPSSDRLINVLSTREVDCFKPLHENLRTMFKCKKFCDVQLRVNGKIFPAHKSILAARSPVFSAMFDVEMIESQTGVVDVCDVSPETFNQFLEFLYTGTVSELDCDSSIKLLLVAEKYQVLSLKEKCSSILRQKLSTDKAEEIFEISEFLGLTSLGTAALHFLKANEIPSLYSYVVQN